MKKLLFILPFLALVACGTKQENSRDIPTSTDSLMVDVMRAVVDTNRSYLEIKEELDENENQATIDTQENDIEDEIDEIIDQIKEDDAKFAVDSG